MPESRQIKLRFPTCRHYQSLNATRRHPNRNVTRLARHAASAVRPPTHPSSDASTIHTPGSSDHWRCYRRRRQTTTTATHDKRWQTDPLHGSVIILFYLLSVRQVCRSCSALSIRQRARPAFCDVFLRNYLTHIHTYTHTYIHTHYIAKLHGLRCIWRHTAIYSQSRRFPLAYSTGDTTVYLFTDATSHRCHAHVGLQHLNVDTILHFNRTVIYTYNIVNRVTDVRP